MSIIKEDVDATVTSTETDLIYMNAISTYSRSFFIINDDGQNITLKIYGSPDGIKLGDKDKDGIAYTQTEINKHWEHLLSYDTAVNPGVSKGIDLSQENYSFYKLSASVASGQSDVRIYAMKNYIADGVKNDY